MEEGDARRINAGKDAIQGIWYQERWLPVSSSLRSLNSPLCRWCMCCSADQQVVNGASVPENLSIVAT